MALFESSSERRKVLLPSALNNINTAEQWLRDIRSSAGAEVCAQTIELLLGAQLVDDQLGVDVSRLEAVLRLNSLTQAEHDADCTHYLLQAYLPRELELRLRNGILDYAYAFQQSYAVFTGQAAQKQVTKDKEKFAQAFSRQLFYLCEAARWQMFRYFMPDEQFWRQVNAVYRQAEVLGIETTPIFLFPDHDNATTVQDQFLVLMMLGQLSGGNLTARQVNMAYQLLRRLSPHVEICEDKEFGASFMVDLRDNQPAQRIKNRNEHDAEQMTSSIRYWDTTDLVITISDWSIEIDAGRMPDELKGEFYATPDAEFLRFLCREWAPQPMPLTRSERFVVHDKKISVIHRLPVIHQQIRLQAAYASNSESHGDLNVYNGLSSSQLAVDSAARLTTYEWVVRDESESGLGIQIAPKDADWLDINTLFAFRENGSGPWSLALVRRIRRFSEQDVFIGAGRLSDQILPVSLRNLDGLLPDNTLPVEWSWLGGQIALFAPIRQHKKVASGLLMPLSLYMPGRKFIMAARGKNFTITLLRTLERGRDWCLAEVKRAEEGSK